MEAAGAVTVSVVIPTFNRAGPVVEAVRSALAQDPPPLEVIVADDGSTDGTEAALAPFVRAGQVRYLRLQGPPQGPARARNAAAAAARGTHLAFLDSDDVWLPGKLAVQVKTLAAHPEAALHGMAARFVYPDGREVVRRGPRRAGDFFLDVYADYHFQTSGSAVRRDRFLEIGGFDPSAQPSEDLDLWLRMTARWPAAFDPEVGVVLRKLGDNYSRDRIRLRANAIRVLEQHRDPLRIPDPLYRRVTSDLAIALGRNYLILGQRDEAIRWFRLAVSRTPLRVRAWRYLARGLLGLAPRSRIDRRA